MRQPTTDDTTLTCSFCDKTQHEVETLVAGPGVFICDECVARCNQILDAAEAKSDSSPTTTSATAEPETPVVKQLRSLDTGVLRQNLARAEKTRGQIGTTQKLLVSILRDRGSSWAEIGKVLGVSRQAVWRRFGSPDDTRGQTGQRMLALTFRTAAQLAGSVDSPVTPTTLTIPITKPFQPGQTLYLLLDLPGPGDKVGVDSTVVEAVTSAAGEQKAIRARLAADADGARAAIAKALSAS